MLTDHTLLQERALERAGIGHNGGPPIEKINGRWDLLTDKQKRVLSMLVGDQRHSCIVGGSRSGKTTLILRLMITRALKVKSRHAILRFRSNAVWPSIGMDTFPKVMATFFPGVVYKEEKTLRYFEFENGSQIWLGGLDDKDRAEKILGNEYSTIFFNECSQIPYSSILIALSRLAENVPGLTQRAIYDLNPSSTRHWTNIMFGDGLDPISNRPLLYPEQYKRAFMNPSDNIQHLTLEYLQSLDAMPERHRKRFRDGEYVDESDDALWKLSTLINCRVLPNEVPQLVRVIVAVDPSGAKNAYDQSHDAIGIIVVGVGEDGKCYVLSDRTILAGPDAWAKAAVQAYHAFRADCIVAETNFGGAMVESVIRTADPSVPVRAVVASRGKSVRAEPVAALYEQGRVKHVEPDPLNPGGLLGMEFTELEEELQNFTVLGYMGPRSPNRADALVWGVTSLMLEENVDGWLQFWKKKAEGSLEKPDPSQTKSLSTAMRAGTPNAPKPVPMGPAVFEVEPHQNFAMPSPDGKSRSYTADGNGHLIVLLKEHVEMFDKQGHKRLEVE